MQGTTDMLISFTLLLPSLFCGASAALFYHVRKNARLLEGGGSMTARQKIFSVLPTTTPSKHAASLVRQSTKLLLRTVIVYGRQA